MTCSVILGEAKNLFDLSIREQQREILRSAQNDGILSFPQPARISVALLAQA
jgi:hypothetical protein